MHGQVLTQIKRRTRVAQIFPDEPTVIGLVGAVRADAHDEWQASDAATSPKPRWRS